MKYLIDVERLLSASVTTHCVTVAFGLELYKQLGMVFTLKNKSVNPRTAGGGYPPPPPTVPPKSYFFPLVTSPTYSISLTVHRRARIDSGAPGLSIGYLTILLANRVIEIIATFCENNPILRKFDLFSPCDLKFDLIKK